MIATSIGVIIALWGVLAPRADSLAVAGVYEVTRSVDTDTCGTGAATAAGPVFAVVIHAPGGAALVVQIGGPQNPRAYPGRATDGGAFSLDAAATTTFDGGQFTARSFTIVETTTGASGGAGSTPCRTVTRWRATKHGEPNVVGVVRPTDADTAGALRISGAYTLTKTVTSDTCAAGPSPASPFGNPGVIARDPGATTFVLNDHGTRNITGRTNADGTFTVDPLHALVMERIQAVDTFSEGRFTPTGFRAIVTTALAANPNRGGGGPCRIVTRWIGERLVARGSRPVGL